MRSRKLKETEIWIEKYGFKSGSDQTKNSRSILGWMHVGRNVTYECFLSHPVSAVSIFKCSECLYVLKKMFYGGDII